MRSAWSERRKADVIASTSGDRIGRAATDCDFAPRLADGCLPDIAMVVCLSLIAALRSLLGIDAMYETGRLAVSQEGHSG